MITRTYGSFGAVHEDRMVSHVQQMTQRVRHGLVVDANERFLQQHKSSQQDIKKGQMGVVVSLTLLPSIGH